MKQKFLIAIYLATFLFISREAWAQSKPNKRLPNNSVMYWQKVDSINIYTNYTQIFWHKKGTNISVKLKPNEHYKVDTCGTVNYY